MFKKLWKVLVFLALPQMNLFAQANNECIVNNTAFSLGEKVTYKVVYNWNSLWLNAGEVEFTINSGFFNSKPCFHMVGYGATYKSYDWFYKVRDTYESYIDMQTLQPLRFVRNVDEGGFTFNQNVTFEHSQNKATSGNGTFNIPDCVQDVLSAIYYARNIDFSNRSLNDTVPLTLFLDDSIYPVYIRYLGKETLETKRGTFRCIKFSPLLIAGTIFKGGEEMKVWVTDDANKIPVQVESPIIVGSVRAELNKYEGLRNPVTAKVK